MGVPFHRVRTCGHFLLAARGASVHSFRLDNGAHLAVWRVPGSEPRPDAAGDQVEGDGEAAHPNKKRKLGESEAGAVDTELEKAPETAKLDGQATTPLSKSQKKRQARKKNTPDTTTTTTITTDGPDLSTLALRSADLPVVSILEPAPDGCHVVVVLGHDKTVRVLAVDAEGRLTQKSARPMPKRPCAVALASDGHTILCGDKFGDVYALPLEEPAEAPAAEAAPAPATAPAPASEAAPTPTPAATPDTTTPLQLRANHLTVHTKGNLQALQNQLRQKELQKQKEQQAKKEPEVHHQLLLGHVSMLTAVVTAVARDGPRTRPLILTADRDEHIRVTRGVLGQTHVIETFCLGHTSFVSRLCVLPTTSAPTNRLVSGGGDGTLRLWSYWPEGRQMGAPVALAPVVAAALHAADKTTPPPAKLAVSGLWAVSVQDASSPSSSSPHVVVLCERVPALFFFAVTGDGDSDSDSLVHAQTLRLPGGRIPLDVAAVSSGRLLVATMAGDGGPEQQGSSSSLVSLQYTDDATWSVADSPIATAFAAADAGADADLPPAVAPAALRQLLLYSTESLRKDSDEGGGEKKKREG